MQLQDQVGESRRFQVSPNRYCCNDVDQTHIGIFFNQPNPGTILSGNHIRRHNTGLWVRGRIDIQTDRGNQWHNECDVFDAESSVDPVLSQFQIPYADCWSTFWPHDDLIDPDQDHCSFNPNDWFIVSEGSNSNPCITGDCPSYTIPFGPGDEPGWSAVGYSK